MKRYLAFLLSLLLGAGSALAQTGETINQLSPGAGLSGTEQIPMYQGSNPAVTTTPSAVAAYAVGSPRSGLNGWVNIRDPAFGATGNGTTDDTAAIQAAIDYAFAHDLPGVYCPNGVYKTSSTIYLDPPGNLRSNFSAPTNFSFTMAFFGDPSSGWEHVFGCQISPNFNNGIAFIVGTGQSMRVSDIKITGPDNAYRGNLNSSGVGIGIAGGNGGASGTLIENTSVDNFYSLYKTDANGACCLSDTNTFRKVGGSNGYYGINIYGNEVYVNHIIDPYLESVTVGISGRYDSVKVTGGVFLSGGRSNSFSISGTSSVAGCATAICFTTTIAAPDAYIPNVYNAYTIITPHYGVIPLVMTAFNSGTNVATFASYGSWLRANYGTLSLGAAFSGEIQAVTTLYAAEQSIAALGVGIDLDGMHIETGTCTSVMTLQNLWGAQVSSKVTEPYFNYDPSLAATSTTAAHKLCQQAFPILGGSATGFSSIEYGNTSGAPLYSLDLEGGNWGVATNPLIIDVLPWTDIHGSRLSSSAFNLRLFDYDGAAYHQLGETRYPFAGNWADATAQFASEARGTGRWDNDYFLPQSALQSGQANNVLLAFFQQSELTTDFCGYEPCPWTTPNLSPTTYALVSGSLGALGTYPPVACRTVFKSVNWNTGAIMPPSTVGGGIFLRSASCPGYSWGQNLTTATLGATTNAVVTGTISNGSGGSGTILNVSAITSGALHPGDQLTGSSVPAGEHILWQTSGTAGSTGNYLVSDAATITTGETLTDPVAAWVYQADSDVLYLDNATIYWMFPGMGIAINNGGGAQPYTVTGVYPSLGYVTVMWASTNNGGALQGTAGTDYSCSSSCTIGQAAYSWTAY